jgi:hypothetical protein
MSEGRLLRRTDCPRCNRGPPTMHLGICPRCNRGLPAMHLGICPRCNRGPSTMLPHPLPPPLPHTHPRGLTCMAWSWMRPQGSKREGTSMKSAPAVMVWARGLLNLTTPTATPGYLANTCLSSSSRAFFPVPRMTTWGGGHGMREMCVSTCARERVCGAKSRPCARVRARAFGGVRAVHCALF